MSYQKLLGRVFKKSLISLVILATVLWSFGGSFWPLRSLVHTAQAAITASDVIDMVMPGQMAGPRMYFPVLGINLAGSGSETLLSATVRVVIPGGSSFTPNAGLAALSVNQNSGVALYKDNKTSGAFGWMDPSSDTFLTPTVAPTWTQINSSTYDTTITLAAPNAIPADNLGNNSGNDYFVVIQTSDAPAPGSSFKVQIPINGIAVGGTTLPAVASPSSPNTIIIGSGGMMGSSLVISEIQTAGTGGASDEFIELYNRTETEANLTGWSLQYKDGAGEALSASSPAAKINLSGTVPAHKFLLIANSSGYDYGGTVAADLTYTDSNFALSATGGTVFLVNNQTAITNSGEGSIKDRVAWGTGNLYAEGTAATAPASNGGLERKSCPESTVSSMTTGMDVTMGNNYDSENNINDFIVRTTSDPQNSSSTAESPNMSEQNPVTINEIYYNKTSLANQWIEIYNGAGGQQSVQGWKIKAAGSTYTIPNGTNIAAGSYLLVYWGAAGTNTVQTLYTGTGGITAMSTLAGDVYFTDAGNAAKDYVEYGAGGQTSEATAGSSQWPAGEFVPLVLQGQSSGRGTNGYDNNRASNWQTFSTSTPGAANSGGDAFAPDPVTNVALADSDTTNFGLDGRDVTITWTKASATDSTFDKYVVYLLPAATALDTAVHTPFANVYSGQNTQSFVGSASRTTDSAGNALATGSYKAYVMTMDFAFNKSAPTASAAATLTAEDAGTAGTDTMPPMIMSMGLWSTKGGATTTIFASVSDDRALHATVPTQLKWRVHGGGAFSAVTGTEIVANSKFYKYQIPWDAGWVVATTELDYYLVARDTSNNYTYFTTNPTFDMGVGNHISGVETTADDYPFVLNFVAAAGYIRTLSGTVYNSAGAAVSGAGVIIPGSGLDAVVTGGDGAYSFTVAEGTYNVTAFKPGYMDGWFNGISVIGGNATGNNFYLNAGNSGMGGNVESPHVKWTEPADGSMGAPINIALDATPIVAHMSKAMDSATINDTNAADASSNIYLTKTGEDRMPGAVIYDSSVPTDLKVKFYSTTALTEGTTYYFVIKSAVVDENGNPLVGNQPDGKYVMSFTTFTAVTIGQGGQTFGQGSGYPPYVTGSMPSGGSINVPLNIKITVNFSEPMDATTIEATSSTGNNVKLYDTGSGQYLTLSSVVLDDLTKTTATINTASALTSNHSYAIRVLGGAKSAKGVSMGNPSQSGYATQIFFQADFTTGATSDTTAPQVIGTNLKMYADPSNPGCDITTMGCLINVPTNVGIIGFGFNKDMDASTFDTTNITLKLGNTAVDGKAKYESLDRRGKFYLTSALQPKNTYTFTVGTGVKAINGQALASAYTFLFTTSDSVDNVAPFVMFGRATESKLAITFSEPMNSAKITDSTKWTYSVLNSANYTLQTDQGPPPAPGTAYGNGGTLADDTGLSFAYDETSNTVTIEGLSFTVGGGGFRAWINNVKDLSGNLIQDNSNTPPNFGANAMGGPLESSANVGMMMGPSGGGMMGPPPTSVIQGSGPAVGMASGTMMQVTDFGGKNPAMMGIRPIGVWPQNMLAGMTSLYMIDLPLSQLIPAGGKIVLTFPAGFDVSGAKNADASGNFAHYDINGPGTGKVVLASNEGTLPTGAATGGQAADGVYVIFSPTTPQVGIILGAVATQANDFLHLEIEGIKNSPEAMDFNTSGYSINIKTMSGTTVLENQSSMPFFIKAGGSSTLTGTITFKDSSGSNKAVTVNDIPVFLMSPMTGPMEQEVDFSNSAAGTFNFYNLPTGDYMIATQPLQTIGSTDYYADMPMGVPLTITSGLNTYAVIFTEQSNTNKAGLTVYITGTFTSEDIDIFAGGPTGFSVKTVTLNGTFTNAVPSTQTIYLPSTGNWMIGMGPAMPKGPMAKAGAPMTFNWMPPRSIEVVVSGTPGSWTWKDDDGAASGDTSATDGKITFGISTANKTISGHVKDASNNAISNVEVFAYSPMGGFGNHSQTDTDGAFSLKVQEGVYKVGAFMAGMPPSQEVSIEAKGGAIYANGVVTTDLILTVSKPDYTISGTVTDATNVIKDASVYAYRTDGPGHAEAMTDSKGAFILYVANGTWKVGVFLPGYGNLPEQTITINNTSESGLTFAPSANTTFVTVSDRIYKDKDNSGDYTPGDEAIANAHVIIEGTNYVNDAMTDANGSFTTKVPSGTYDIKAWSPTFGKLPTVDDVAMTSNMTNTGNADIPVPDTKTITVNFKDSQGNAVNVNEALIQADKIGTKNIGNETVQENVSSVSLQVPAGTNYQYILDVDIPGIPDENLVMTAGGGGTTVTPTDVDSDLTNELYKVVVDSDETVTVTLPALYTVSGQVKDGSGTAVADAVVHIEKPGTDVELDVQADSSGNYTVQLPASGATPYLIQADKAGYVDTSSSLTITANKSDADLTTTAAAITIAGQVKVGSTGVASAQVVAEQLGGGFVTTEADVSGNYTMQVIPGDWKISAGGESYQSEQYSTVINTNSGNVNGINITLDTTQSGLADTKTEPVTSSSGGTIDRDSDAGLQMSIPTNALKSSTQGFDKTYSTNTAETSNVFSSVTANIIGDEAFDVSAFIYAGSSSKPEQVTNLSQDAMINKTYTKAELSAEGIDTFGEVELMKMSSFDGTAQNWIAMPTTITYLDSAGAPVIPTNTLSNVSQIVVNGTTEHFSVFAATNPTPDGLAPASPSGLSATAGNAQVVLSWTVPTTNADGSTLSDLLGYEIYRATASSGPFTQINNADVTGTTYTDSAVSNGLTYYYKITAADTGGIESAMTSAVNATPIASTTGGGSVVVTTPTPTPEPMPTSTTGEVTATSASGGKTTLTTTEGAKVIVEVSASTITANTTVKAMSVASSAITAAAPVPSGKAFVTAFDLSATSAGVSVKTFSKNITLKFTYADSQIAGLDEDTLKVYHWDGSKWTALSGLIDKAGNTITVTTTQFSYFAIFGEKTGQTTEQKSETKAPVIKPISQMTIAELKAEIARITVLIKQLQAELAKLRGEAETKAETTIFIIPPDCQSFTRNLQVGMSGADVKCLQAILNSNSQTQVAASGIGSPGQETEYFGELTKLAVIRFQEFYGDEILRPAGLANGTGYVGSSTRAKLNNLFGI